MADGGGDEQNRELVRSIRREVGKLGEQWHALLERSEQWKRRLDDLVTVSAVLLLIYIYLNVCGAALVCSWVGILHLGTGFSTQLGN